MLGLGCLLCQIEKKWYFVELRAMVRFETLIVNKLVICYMPSCWVTKNQRKKLALGRKRALLRMEVSY